MPDLDQTHIQEGSSSSADIGHVRVPQKRRAGDQLLAHGQGAKRYKIK